MKTKMITIAVFLFLLGQASAQTAKDVFESYIEKRKERNTFHTKVDYALYKGKTGSKVYEQYSGIQEQQNKQSYLQLGNMQSVQGEDFVVKLNTEEKAMLVGLSSKPITQDFSQIDFTAIHKWVDIDNLNDLGNTWEITLLPKGTLKSQFTKIKLEVAKDTYYLIKQTLFFSTISDFSQYTKSETPDYDVARLEITNSEHSNSISNTAVFDKEYYFNYQNNNITASTRFKDFEILYAQ